MTSPSGLTPDGAYTGTGGFADYAATTEGEWEASITASESTPWGSGGLLGALFAGLTSGKPFVVALLEALGNAIFGGISDVIDEVSDWLNALGDGFTDKWNGLAGAANASSYANAQLAASARPIVDLFDGAVGNLSSSWDVSTVGSGGGEIQQDGLGNAWWDAFGGVARGNRCRWNVAQTATNSQLMTIVLATPPEAPAAADSFVRMLGHVVDTGTVDDYVFAEIGYDYAKIGYRAGGSEVVLDTETITSSVGDVWDFVCGEFDSDYHFRLKQNGVTVVDTTDAGTAHTIGAGYRSVGFEMYAAVKVAFTSQTSPGKIAVFSADDATWGS